MTRKNRIIVAILLTILLGGMWAYQDDAKNDLPYQSHPLVCIGTDFFCGFLVASTFYFGSGWLAKRNQLKANSIDGELYGQVANELKDKTLILGLWTRAYAEMNGNEAKAKALYIRYRVQELRQKRLDTRRQQQLDARQQADDIRKKAKEMHRSAEFEKPPLSLLSKVIFVIAAIVCGVIAIISAIGCLGVILDATVDKSSNNIDLTELVFGLLFGCAMAFGSGWIARGCLRVVKR